MRNTATRSEMNGRGLRIFLKIPGNPAFFMAAKYDLRSAIWRTLMMTHADDTATTIPREAAQEYEVHMNIQRMMNIIVTKSCLCERSFLA